MRYDDALKIIADHYGFSSQADMLCEESAEFTVALNKLRRGNNEAYKNVDKWVAEHPVKTYAMDFFEKFPNAPRDIDGSLRACRENIYGGRKDCPSGGCIECWNREMKEDE